MGRAEILVLCGLLSLGCSRMCQEKLPADSPQHLQLGTLILSMGNGCGSAGGRDDVLQERLESLP